MTINERVSDATIDGILSGVIEGVEPTTQEVAMAAEIKQYRAAAEPVAFRWRWKDDGMNKPGEWIYHDMMHFEAINRQPTRECQLVYAAPQVTSVPAVPDGLTIAREIIKEAWRLIPQSDSVQSAAWHTAASIFLNDSTAAPAVQAEQLSGNTEQVSQPYTLPDGYALVPVELTPDMRAAWDSAPYTDDDDHDMRGAYRAMIAAAPDFREILNSSTKSPATSPIDHGYRADCECSGCIATARICAELAVRPPEIPDCRCRACRPVTMNDMRFVVCPECGNKRCPHANDHRNACTGSNEPGQEGSAYPAEPKQEAE